MAKIPQKIDKYPIETLIATGGMGAVYKGTHPTLDRPVIIKKLTLRGNSQFADRFKREAVIMMGFRHENIVDFYDHFKPKSKDAGAGYYYMVMEYVNGCSLADLLDRRRYLDEDIALLIFRDTLRALDYSHEQGVVHRDVKPANILLSRSGDVKLTDFGIAHNDEAGSDGLTKDGMTLGTPAYMAPEQFRDPGKVDRRADIYSSGVLLYEILTGNKPYAGASLPEMLERIRKGRYESLRRVRPETSAFTTAIVARCMKARPEARYRDGKVLLKKLDRYFRRRNVDTLRKRIADLVKGKKRTTDTESSKKRIHPGRIIAWSAAGFGLIVLLALAAVTLTLSGKMPRALLPDSVGIAMVEIPLPENTYLTRRTPERDIPPPSVRASFFSGDDEFSINVRERTREDADGGIRRRFQGGRDYYRVGPGASIFLPADDDIGNHRLVSRPILLRPGPYQVKVRIDDELHWRGMVIPSLRERARISDGNGITTLSVPWEPRSEGAEIVWEAQDRYSGKILTETATALVDPNDKTVSPFSIGNRITNLRSGSAYIITVASDGYLPQTFNVRIDEGSRRMNLTCDLVVEPALLELRSAVGAVRPMLNGSRVFTAGGNGGGSGVVPVTDEEPIELSIVPGEYLLSAKRGRVEVATDLILRPGDRVTYTLDESGEGEYFWIGGEE